MTDEPDYYAILQVAPGADPDVINAAYRRLATKYHPDVNPSADALERMKQMNAAYAVLSDPLKRAEYDRARRSTNSRRPAPPLVDGSWRDTARRLLVPAGLLLFMLLSTRMGARAGFIAAVVLVALAYYLLSQSDKTSK